MDYRHKDLDELKWMSPPNLVGEERRAWLLVNGYFGGTAKEAEAREAIVTIKNISRLRRQEIRARRKQLREAMSRNQQET